MLVLHMAQGIQGFKVSMLELSEWREKLKGFSGEVPIPYEALAIQRVQEGIDPLHFRMQD